MICTIKNLSVKLQNSLQLLHNISHTIDRNDFLIVLGSNGSGKTTMLKAINGTVKYSGSIKILDKIEVKKAKDTVISRHIGTITQNVTDSLFMEFSLLQNFQMYSQSFYEEADISKFLAIVESVKPKLIKLIDSKVSTLSGGERQCFLLALNLFFKRDLLLLDEHTSALDPKTAAEVMEITSEKLKETNTTCIMTTHSLDDAIKYGNKLIAMKNGVIIETFNEEEKRNLTKVDLLKLY